MRWNCLSIPKLQRCTLNWACDYLFISGNISQCKLIFYIQRIIEKLFSIDLMNWHFVVYHLPQSVRNSTQILSNAIGAWIIRKTQVQKFLVTDMNDNVKTCYMFVLNLLQFSLEIIQYNDLVCFYHIWGKNCHEDSVVVTPPSKYNWNERVSNW